jgi:ATP-dependent RNA helicase DDX23/PRP28
MRFGAEIIIATPGRLKDCIERHILVLSQCTYVVMDEADRMVSLGFEEAINFILDSLPVTNFKPDTAEAEDPNKMTMVISAPEGDDSVLPQLALYRQTVRFPPIDLLIALMRISDRSCSRHRCQQRSSDSPRNTCDGRPSSLSVLPVRLSIPSSSVSNSLVETIRRSAFPSYRANSRNADSRRGRHRLIEVLNTGGFDPPMIVFVNTKKACDVLAKDLHRAQVRLLFRPFGIATNHVHPQWSATTLHSGKNQEQREAALAALRAGECDVLVATDLAGRGIDVPDVSLVVNFEMSKTIEAYVHRIGRTGRAGRTGVALTFVNDGDEEVMFVVFCFLGDQD